MIRVAIIGCGKMADQHALQIRRISGAEIVAVCDAELLMAQQLAERFRIPGVFADANEMLATVPCDVVHITTSPASHFSLGKQCLQAGRNVYIEKPFTLDTSEAVELIRLADANFVKLTAGHNAQFTPAMIRMREMVNAGFLGGRPVHLESHYCYSFGDARYAQAVLGDDDHWVRKLPGSLLQNIISHGISKIAEFLSDERPIVLARGFTSKFLRDGGHGDVIDEVRVIIQDREQTTAYFTFSSQIRPVPHQFRLYGPKASLIVDDDHQIVIRIDGSEYRSYLNYFIPPLQYALQYSSNFLRNAAAFVRRDFHLPNDSALHTLIGSFYKSIEGAAPLPIPYREIVVTSQIMDEIFNQVRTCRESL